MSYGQVNADVIGTSVTGSNLGAGNASIMKNRIINGSMTIDQRNAGASLSVTTTTPYTLDRWQALSVPNTIFTVQQNAASVTPPAGFVNYLGVTSTASTSLGATDRTAIRQVIEGYNIADLGWGTANAKAITLSFWVRSSLTGTFGGSLINGGGTRSYPFTYTISSANTWTQISITVAGDTTGTWATDNSGGLNLTFGLGVGSTYSGTAGAWAGALYYSATGATSVVGTSGATFYITGVQLEVGSSATGFEYVNYQTSLANCQRYYWQQNYTSTIVRFGMGTSAGTTTDGFQTSLPVTMRVSPTAILLNIGLYDGTTTFTISSLGVNYSTPSLLSAVINNSASITAGKSVQLYAINSSAVISASAEL